MDDIFTLPRLALDCSEQRTAAADDHDGELSFSFGGGQRPDSTGQNAALDNPTLDRWFDTNAFRLPAQYTFDNLGRMHPSLRAAFVEALDMSVFKRFQIAGERVALELRRESFNALNHPVFGAPNTTVGNAQSPRIWKTAGTSAGSGRIKRLSACLPTEGGID